MKIFILSLLFAASASLAFSDTIAGFDFRDLGTSGLDTAVNGFAADRTSFSNGYQTSGYLSDAGSAGFYSNGRAATGAALLAGLDQTTTASFGAAETGQNSLNIFSPSASYRAFTVNFNGSTDVKMYYDWNGGGSNPTTSFMNVSYVVDGVSQALTYSSFGSLGNWTTSESAGLNSLAGQSDAVIDLSAVSGTITSITLDLVGMTPDSRVGFDNILVTGTAVIPEPSTYALLLGLVGLAFVCFRKKS